MASWGQKEQTANAANVNPRKSVLRFGRNAKEAKQNTKHRTVSWGLGAGTVRDRKFRFSAIGSRMVSWLFFDVHVRSLIDSMPLAAWFLRAYFGPGLDTASFSIAAAYFTLLTTAFNALVPPCR